MRTTRRALVLGAVLALVTSACKKDARCRRCGMKLEAKSAWRAELVGEDGKVTEFDTPRCALTSWREGQTPAKSIRVQEYYDHVTKDGTEVRFILGGDVVGPMGPDFVPVDPARASKFIQDHGGERALKLEELDAAFLRAN